MRKRGHREVDEERTAVDRREVTNQCHIFSRLYTLHTGTRTRTQSTWLTQQANKRCPGAQLMISLSCELCQARSASMISGTTT